MNREILVIFIAVVAGIFIGALTVLLIMNEQLIKQKEEINKKHHPENDTVPQYVPMEERQSIEDNSETKIRHTGKEKRQVSDEAEADDVVENIILQNRIKDHSSSHIRQQCCQDGEDVNIAVQKARKTEDYNYSGMKRAMDKQKAINEAEQAAEIAVKLQQFSEQTRLEQEQITRENTEREKLMQEQFERELALNEASKECERAGQEIINTVMQNEINMINTRKGV